MKSDNFYITGYGVVSAIGIGREESLDALRGKKSGIGNIEILNTVHKDTFKVGELAKTNEELAELLSIAKSDLPKYSRTSLLGLLAAKEAVEIAGVDLGDGLRTGLISSTTVGGMDKTELEYESRNYASGFVETHSCGDSTDKIADYLGIKHYRTTINTACSSGANAIIHGIRLMRHGIVDRVLVGGVDALSVFTLNGFNSLMIYDKQECQPFNKNRRGLNLGEGAGFLMLEMQCDNKKHFGKVVGWANTNDAYHQTASSPDGDGAFAAMTKALEVAKLSPSDIDYVNAHGTGTDNNDMSESVALKRFFGEAMPPFSSTKAYTGHTLGAAAAIEAVFSVMAIEHGVVYPNLRFEEPIDELGIKPETDLQEGLSLNYVLSNSFGFGGNCSSVIFSK